MVATICFVGDENKIRLQNLRDRLQTLVTQGHEAHQLLGDVVMDEAIDLFQIVEIVLGTEEHLNITYPVPASSSA